MRREGSKARLRHVLFAFYLIACAGALTWPGYEWLGNRIEPFVLGLPFAFAWNVGWILMTFLVLVVYHLARGRG